MQRWAEGRRIVSGFVVAPKAGRDLIKIWKHIAVDSVKNADRMYERFLHTFAALGKTPLLGVASDRIEPSVRKFPLGNYVIYYKPRKTRVWISRVIHGKRRQKKAYDQQ